MLSNVADAVSDFPVLAVQDVERECAAACASLAMATPLNVALRPGDILRLQHHLLALLLQPEPSVPFTPSLKVGKTLHRQCYVRITPTMLMTSNLSQSLQ